MNLPKWLQPALWGGVAGAVLAGIIGFGFAGWMTGDTAATMADRQSSAAVADALTPYCLELAENDPNTVALMVEFSAGGRASRRQLVLDAGWATPLGTEEPNRDLAQACQLQLAEAL